MQQQIEGLWSLVSFEQRYDDGRVTYPFGKDVHGYIFYGKDDIMFASIQRAGCTPFKTGMQWTASQDEKAEAYDSCIMYCGRYELKGNQVTHAIEISLFPNWIGQRQLRTLKLESGALHVTARLEDGTAEARTSYLSFRRAVR